MEVLMINPNQTILKVIPAKTKEEIRGTMGRKIRVAAYVRVSTESELQETSYDLQYKYYKEKIEKNPDWVFVNIYGDEGKSGTNLTHRKNFVRMIEDCKAGKIDLILVKSASRFARNTLDSLKTIRMLKEMNVDMYFETTNTSILNDNCEFMLTLLSAMAQEESRDKSDSMTWSIERRYDMGNFMLTPLLGYDKLKGRENNLIINTEEAKTVQICFAMAGLGYSYEDIAKVLIELQRPTKRGLLSWSAERVKGILTSEKYCGELISRKTFTPDFLTHKPKKNRGEKKQVRVGNHHDAIVPKGVDTIAKKILTNRKGSKSKGIPQLKSIKEGALQGFVVVNKNFSGFTFEEYLDASEKNSTNENMVVLAQRTGYFDLREWVAVASSLFDNGIKKPNCQIKNGQIWFNSAAVREMNTEYVEVLFHPVERVIAIRPSSASKAESIKVARKINGKLKSQKVSLADFFAVVYTESKIKPEHIIRCFGERRIKRIESKRKSTDEWVLFFDLREAEILVGNEIAIPKRSAIAYGNEFYEKYTVCGINQIDVKEVWEVLTPGEENNSLAGQMIELLPFAKEILKDINVDIVPIKKTGADKIVENKEATI
jgi:DNA invertase Pin-like site-specific DNA recombinase